ncbi:TetR/AcrR family transcriptional regulator [Denitratisoma sp. DHT3]|uniref:TetR/AcrR family transcriptional regulator n=1 Tax=Denitratisoma sp. DHT3 TaxID=1981880 RepID=UPI0016452DCE|nr:helix-turn-helix domain-containing protein [Denitratisoma sp. DHT3]
MPLKTRQKSALSASRDRRPGSGEATKAALLKAAEKVFAEYGFSTARLDHVADAVGIRRASLLYHFPTKQELYDQVEADIFRELEAYAEQKLRDCKTPWEQLLTLIDVWLEFWTGRPTGARIILRITADITPRINDPIQFAGPIILHFERIIRSGIEQGEFIECNASDLICLLGGSILQYVCIAPHLGPVRSYHPDDPARMAAFRAMVHRAARALLTPPGK